MGLVESGAGIALLGPAGVGKSRLLHELAGQAEKSGVAVVRAVASETMRTIPFAPFLELLPGDPTQDRLAMLGAARAALETRGADSGTLITIDDAHHLDEASLSFLVSVVSSRVANVVLTARAGEQMGADLVDLWTNGVIARIDLAPLERADADALIAAVLGPVAPDLADELWRLTEGNPLLLHEVIEGAVGQTIERRDDVWVMTGTLTESARLSDLVSSRLGALPDRLRAAMDVVAVSSPLPYPLAEEVLSDELADLEDRGLVVSVDTEDGPALVPAHPLYGEILESHLGDARSRRAHRRLVEGAHAADGVVDPVRAALWQENSGWIEFVELAVNGAREALVRHDPALAQRLLEPLGTADDHIAVLLGRSLSYQRQFAAAEEALAGREPGDPLLLGELVSIRAQNLAFGLGEIGEARRILETHAAAIESPDIRARLLNERAMISAINGDFRDAISVSDQVLNEQGTSDVPRAAAYVTLTVALAMIGDSGRFDEITDAAIGAAERVRDTLPMARDQVEVMRMSSLLHAGRVPEAVALCEAAIAPDRGVDAMTTTWMSATGLAHQISGDLATAADVVGRSLDLFAQLDPFGLEPQARGVNALALGQMNDPAAGRPIAGVELSVPAPRLAVWVERGRAWSEVAAGNVGAGAAIAAEAGRSAVAGEHYAWGVFAFHDAARLGHPDLVIDDVARLDLAEEARLLVAIRDHVAALSRGDGEALHEVGVRMMTMSAPLFAAESFAQAAAVMAASDDHVAAARSEALSHASQLRCVGADTPALRTRPGLVSARQVEVALDAARGMTSTEISKQRFISVRTVDNHLSTVYRRVGVAGRDELPELFEVTLGGGASPNTIRED